MEAIPGLILVAIGPKDLGPLVRALFGYVFLPSNASMIRAAALFPSKQIFRKGSIVNNFAKGLRSVVLTGLLVAALPLAASAMTIGVSDEVDSSILSGHVTQCSGSASVSQGTEWTSSSSSKTDWGTETGTTAAYTVDPAASATNVNGQYVSTASSSGGSAGTYANASYQTSSLQGGSEQQTSLVNTVSTFANP